MRPSGVLTRDPALRRPIGFCKARERMVADALLFDASKPWLDSAVFLERVRRDPLPSGCEIHKLNATLTVCYSIFSR